MCACDPPCVPLEGNWPTETCPNPDCGDETLRTPVGAHEVNAGALGLTFHCKTCPTRWYSVYEIASEATA